MTQPPNFAIIPDQQDVARLERDLRFHPCTNDSPRTLSRAQVEQFNRDGFLKGLRVFSPAEADATRRYFDDLLARVLAAGGDSYSISCCTARRRTAPPGAAAGSRCASAPPTSAPGWAGTPRASSSAAPTRPGTGRTRAGRKAIERLCEASPSSPL
jgi:hypothetical protein